MAHTELDLLERRAIEDMLNAKAPVSKIASEIGRHRSTVCREINRIDVLAQVDEGRLSVDNAAKTPDLTRRQTALKIQAQWRPQRRLELSRCRPRQSDPQSQAGL